MRRPRGLATLLAPLVVMAGLAGPLVTASPASAAEILVDGGMDATYAPVPDTAPVNPNWQFGDSVFVSPLCTTTDTWCGDTQSLQDDGTPPRTGTGWVWFGSSNTPAATAFIRQSVTIPAGVTTSLSYWYRNGQVDAPFDATLTVRLDDHVLKVHTEANAAEASYSQFTLDLTPYADGAAHTLSFDYLNGSASTTGGAANNNMTVDDISVTTDTTAPETAFAQAPAAVVKRLIVPVSFSSTEPGSTFLCSLDGALFAACANPLTLTVKPGAHTLRVGARDTSGNVDATPASVTFTAYDCPSLNAAKHRAQHKVRALTKRLKAAVAAGEDAKVLVLEKKLKKAKKALRKARFAYRPCVG